MAGRIAFPVLLVSLALSAQAQRPHPSLPPSKPVIAKSDYSATLFIFPRALTSTGPLFVTLAFDSPGVDRPLGDHQTSSAYYDGGFGFAELPVELPQRDSLGLPFANQGSVLCYTFRWYSARTVPYVALGSWHNCEQLGPGAQPSNLNIPTLRPAAEPAPPSALTSSHRRLLKE